MTDHDKRYWQYEYDLMNMRLIPLMEDWGVPKYGKALEIGCLLGGGSCALRDWGYDVTGIDLDEKAIERAVELKGERMIVFDVQEDPGIYDLIVMHDVIEHVQNKRAILRSIKAKMGAKSTALIAFPPYYSAFGGHQQLKGLPIPWIHLLPGYKNPLPEKLTMNKFELLALSYGLAWKRKAMYLVSPNYLRFGLPAVELPQSIGMNELLCSGVVYLLARAW